MAGIVSYGTHVPSGRLSADTRNWQGRHPRAVADFDEDAVTMAVAAVNDCLAGRDRSDADALYFASTSAPYVEKQSASIVATACDLRDDILATDVAHSLRAGSQALRAALDGVRAGSSAYSVMVASDCRPAAPGSHPETEGGDGAAALLIGADDPIAELVATHSCVSDIHDVWRADGETLLRTADDHFRFEDGYFHAVERCVGGLLQKTGLTMSDFDRVVLYAPDARRHAQALARIGAHREQASASLLERVGSTGTSLAIIGLVEALQTVRPGKRILLVNYGDGADAWALQTTDAIARFPHGAHRSITQQLESSRPVPDYYDFLRWRGMLVTANGRTGAAPAPHTLWRDQASTLRFHGMRCRQCSKVQWPPQRVCVHCRARDDNDPVPLSGELGRLFTYSMDYVARTMDQPLVHGVVDFDIGGRAMMMLADRNIDEIAIGMRLEMALRKFHYADGIHTYMWKAAPLRHQR